MKKEANSLFFVLALDDISAIDAIFSVFENKS